MAAYVFETITQDQAASFATSDILVFQNGSSVGVTVQETSSSGLTLQGISITSGGRTLTFPAGNISVASGLGNVQFNDNSRLVIGKNTADTEASINGTAAGDAIYAFSGGDSIGGSGGADLLNGGLGDDTIIGGTGNDRIFGNDVQNNLPAGSQDGADSIDGGANGDVIQGNQGADTIDGGLDSDRIQGGSGNDFIYGGIAEETGTVTANNGSDSINGNQGNDTILGNGGDDFLRGGQNDDSLNGGNNNDVLMGDAGNDSLDGGLGLDILMGGTGTNSYYFDEGDSAFSTQGGSFANITDQIQGFQLNNDRFRIEPTAGGSSTYVNVEKDNAATFTSLDFARVYAQGLLNERQGGSMTTVDSDTTVAAVQVNADTYIFWDGNNDGFVESAVRLTGINVIDVTSASLFGGV